MNVVHVWFLTYSRGKIYTKLSTLLLAVLQSNMEGTLFCVTPTPICIAYDLVHVGSLWIPWSFSLLVLLSFSPFSLGDEDGYGLGSLWKNLIIWYDDLDCVLFLVFCLIVARLILDCVCAFSICISCFIYSCTVPIWNPTPKENWIIYSCSGATFRVWVQIWIVLIHCSTKRKENSSSHAKKGELNRQMCLILKNFRV